MFTGKILLGLANSLVERNAHAAGYALTLFAQEWYCQVHFFINLAFINFSLIDFASINFAFINGVLIGFTAGPFFS